MSYGDLTLYRHLLTRTRPYWFNMFGIFLLGLLATPLSLLTPVPLAIAVDSVLGDQQPPALLMSLLPESIVSSDSSMLILAAVLVVLIALLTQAQEAGITFLKSYTGEKLVLGFRSQLFQHTQDLSLSYHDAVGTSDSTYRIQYDASSIRYIAIDGFIPFLTAMISFVSMLYVTFLLDPQLALVALTISPIVFLLVRSYRLRLRRHARQIKVLESSAMSVVQEVLTSVRVVKAFGQEEREQERFVTRSSEGAEARVRVTFAESALGLLLGLTMAVGTAAVLYIGVGHVQSGTLTLGALLLVMAYLTQLYGPLKTISRKTASLQSHLASAERALSVLDQTPDIQERAEARTLLRAKGEFFFDEVSFAYERSRPALQDFSMNVPAGTRVGIAGETGAGKSTLVNLVTRFYDPTAGRIMLDGVDLRDYRVVDLRDQFSIVLQEPVLFSTSIAENIAYACPGASEDEITSAACAANAHDFIIRLADGYETQVGERGVRLSGGERQRIALARAFLKDAPIIILDEPTSSVDVETELGIMEAMERLMSDRTCFMIAHRLNTLQDCDLLLTIEDGRLVGEQHLKTGVAPATRSVCSADTGLHRLVGAVEEPSATPNAIPEGSSTAPSAAKQERASAIVWRESAEQLAALYRAEENNERKRRLCALWLLRTGETQADVSRELGIGQRTIQRWIAWYRANGLEEVLRRTRGNRSHERGDTADHSQLLIRLPSTSQGPSSVRSGVDRA